MKTFLTCFIFPIFSSRNVFAASEGPRDELLLLEGIPNESRHRGKCPFIILQKKNIPYSRYRIIS